MAGWGAGNHQLYVHVQVIELSKNAYIKKLIEVICKHRLPKVQFLEYLVKSRVYDITTHMFNINMFKYTL